MTLQRTLRCLLAVAALVDAAPSAFAELAEEALYMPALGQAGQHLFRLNPAAHRAKALQGGALLLRDTESYTLNQEESGDDNLTGTNKDEYVVYGAWTDLGAGAGFGLIHQSQYREVLAKNSAAGDDADDRRELRYDQHSQAKLSIELTAGLSAGLAVRYLFKRYEILGDYFVGEDQRIAYNTTLVGYGAGFHYNFQDKGEIGYVYYPPLRGKTEIQGEELIVVEPGFILADAAYGPTKDWRVGLGVKRGINEIDERAPGSTSPDEQSNISLFGLNLNQYLELKQAVMIGGSLQVAPNINVALSLGQEQRAMNFARLAGLTGLNVNQNADDESPVMQYNRARVLVNIVSNQLELHAGLGFYEVDHSFPDDMNGGEFTAGGRELFITVSANL